MVAGASEIEEVAEVDAGSLKEQVEELIKAGKKPSEAIKEIAKRHQLKKQVVYNQYHEIETIGE